MREIDVSQLDLEALLAGAMDEIRSSASSVPHLLELQKRGTREVFERARNLSKSALAEERTLAVQLLRELGGIPPPFANESFSCLVDLLAHEQNPEVLRWAISAIGYQFIGLSDSMAARVDEAIAAVGRFGQHHNELVRLAVAAAIPNIIGHATPDESGVDVLIRLTHDSNGDVRYYAFSALTDELALTRRDMVVEALKCAASDVDPQIRAAAIRVLAGGTWGE